MNFKRGAAAFVAAVIGMTACTNVFAAVSEYTNGIRFKKIDIHNYEVSADDTIDENPYDVNYFKDYSSKHSDLKIYKEFGNSMGGTYGNTWARFDDFNFGEEEKTLSKINLKVAHPAGYAGAIRIYLLNSRGERQVSISGGKLANPGEDDILVAEHQFTKEDVYGNGWGEAGDLAIAPMVETIKGTYDVLVVFGSTGIGNFFEFSFVAEEIPKEEQESTAKPCDETVKFSEADLYGWNGGYKPGNEYISDTARNKWLIYKDIDFGPDGIKNFKFRIGKEGDYEGYMRMYRVSDEIADGIESFTLNLGKLENGELIFEKYLSSADNTLGWYEPLQKTVKIPDGEYFRDVSNILITFSYAGLGNFYDFSFERITPVTLSNSGSLCYDEFVPFMSDEVKIGYRCAEDTLLSVTIDDKEYQVTAKSDEDFVTITLDGAILPRAHNLTIEPNNYIHINSIVFSKMKIDTAQITVYSNEADTPQNEYTELESLMRSAVIANVNSPIYFSGNAKRYINYENPKELPYVLGDEIYIPVESFAIMTGAYFEEDGDYCQLRFENTELSKKGDILYRQDNNGTATEVENDLIIKNQKHYIPLKKYLQAAGKSVFEKDGILIADNTARLKTLSSDEVFGQVKAEYESLIYEEVAGNVYYVSQDSSASDGNDGSEGAPFATLARASEEAEAGDTVIIKEGVYRETLTPQNGGTAANPVIFKAAEGENVTISALEEVSSLYTEENSMRVYDLDIALPDGRNQVFYKGEALSEGRFPNYTETDTSKLFKRLNLSSLWPTTGDIGMVVDEEGVADKYTFYSEEAKDFEADFFKGGTLVSFHGYAWNQATAKIASSENGYLHLEDTTINWWHGAEKAGNYAYITGTKNAVDLPGEWYVDSDAKKLYIIPYEDTDEYEIKQRQLCIDFKDRQYVQVIGVNTIGGGTRMANSEMCVLNGGKHKNISHYTYTADQHYGFIDSVAYDENNGVNVVDIFDKDGAPLRGEIGMYLGGRDNAIINTNIKYSAAAGIYATGVYGLIYNNLIEETGYMGSYVGGIFIMPDAANGDFRDLRGGHSIYYNTVDKTGRACLEAAANEETAWFRQGVTPFVACDIAYNIFSNASLTAKDTGNVYIHGVQLGDDEEKTKLRNNYIFDARAENSIVNVGIYFDNWAQTAQVYENILFFTEYGRQIKDSSKIHVQTPHNFPTAFAVADVWNNSQLEEAKKFPLDVSDFPNGKKFRAGANSECVNNQSNELMENTVSADELSTIDFEGKYNSLMVFYKADSYGERDTLKVNVDGEENVVYLKANMTEPGVVSSVIVPVNEYDGEKTVSIEYIEQNRTQVLGVMPIDVENDEVVSLVGKTYGGEYTTGNAPVKEGPDYEHLLAYETWGSKTLVYENVNISKAVDTAVISYSSDKKYSGGKVTMYANDEYLCEFTIDKSDWNDYTPIYLKMDKALDIGKYDIRVEFAGQGSQTSNFWWFGFENFENLTKDIYSEKIDIYNTTVAKGTEDKYNGVVVTKDSEFNLDYYDFGGAGYFKLIADYDMLTDEGLTFKLSFEDSDENLILKPEMFSGTIYNIPCQMLSNTLVEGIKNAKITFEGDGSLLIKNLEFYKTPIYLESVNYENGTVSGKLNGIDGQAVISVYSGTGQLKDFKLINSEDNGFEISAATGDKVKIMCLNSFDELKPYCEDITHILIQQ